MSRFTGPSECPTHMDMDSNRATTSYPAPQQYPGYFDETLSDELSLSDHDSNLGGTSVETPAIELERNHYLLNFSGFSINCQVFDYHHRPATISLSAQLSGKFSKATQPTGYSTAIICYRRNLFTVSGSIGLSQSLRYIVYNGQLAAIDSTELMVSAIETLENAPIKLINVPFKGAQTAGAKQTKDDVEPSTQQLMSCATVPIGSDYVNLPVEWKRLQFRISTANNGRRKELQQHFVVSLKVMATLKDGQRVSICETTSNPIIVRGRSPRNFAPKSIAGSVKGNRSRSVTMEPALALGKTLSPPGGSFPHMTVPSTSYGGWPNGMITSGYSESMLVPEAPSYDQYPTTRSTRFNVGLYNEHEADYFGDSTSRRSRIPSQQSPRISPYSSSAFNTYVQQSSYECLPLMTTSWGEQVETLYPDQMMTHPILPTEGRTEALRIKPKRLHSGGRH